MEEEESYESGRERRRRRRAVGDELVVALGEPKWKMAAGGMGRGQRRNYNEIMRKRYIFAAI